MKLYLYIFLVTTLFLLYVEYSIGNVFYRMNSSGIYSFQPMSIISYLMEPLYNSFLWNIRLLDVNYVFVLFISLIVYYKFE